MQVALKIYKLESNEERAEKLMFEFRKLSKLGHPRIVKEHGAV